MNGDISKTLLIAFLVDKNSLSLLERRRFSLVLINVVCNVCLCPPCGIDQGLLVVDNDAPFKAGAEPVLFDPSICSV